MPVSLYPYLLGPRHRWYRRKTIKQLEAGDRAYRSEHPDVVVPGAELRFNVVGACDIAGFLEAGRAIGDVVEKASREAGVRLADDFCGLDFGCGCGRFLIEARRRWPQSRWTGSDVDARAIEWCAENLKGVTAVVNESDPPLPFANGAFDLIWCGSVFTHLDEQKQDAWLLELRRVLSTEGCIIASLMGEASFAGLKMPAWVAERIRTEGFLFLRTGFDEGIHPDWYQSAYHTREYVERHWGEHFKIAAYLPLGLAGYQDLVVLRRA